MRLELVEGVDEDAGGFVHLRGVPQVEIVLVVSVVHYRRRQIDYTRGWNSRNIVHQEVVFRRVYVREVSLYHKLRHVQECGQISAWRCVQNPSRNVELVRYQLQEQAKEHSLYCFVRSFCL